jgi:hypothetical protein
VLIDLGEQRGRLPEHPVPETPEHPYRAGLAVFAAVLLLLLSGSTSPRAPVQPTLVAARGGDTMFVEEERLYVVGAGPRANDAAAPATVVSTYELPSGGLLARTTLAITGAIFHVTEVGATTLVSYQVDTLGAQATVAAVTGTNRELWRAPALLIGVSTADALVLLCERTPRFGNLRWFGADLTSGRTRWSFEQRIQGDTAQADYRDGFPRRLITVTTAGRIEVRDTGTGATVVAAAVPAPPGWSWHGLTVALAGDLIVVGGVGGIAGYSLADLRPRWHSTFDVSGRRVQDCDGLICLIGYRGGVHVLDPRTGRVRWAGANWTGAHRVGEYLLVSGNEGLEGRYPLAVVDPETGVVRGEFGAWQAAGDVRTDGTVIGRLQRIGDDVVTYGVLNPATLAVRVLGTATAVSGDCRATSAVLVCRRIDATVAIWPLTES